MIDAPHPQSGDIVVYRERGVSSGPCGLGPFQGPALTHAPTFAEALKRANEMAVDQRVDLWTSYRTRWADAAPPTFRRVAAHRVPNDKGAG